MTTYYTQDHEWLSVDGDSATVGITDEDEAVVRVLRQSKKPVILAAGTGSPFVTTDTAAAQRALELEAEELDVLG